MHKEIRFSGFGGQGVVLSGIILARAAAIYSGLQVVQTQSHGAESRGGACLSDVIISTEKIDYPASDAPEILVAMSPEAAQKHTRNIKPRGILMIDEDMVTSPPAGGYAQLVRIPATRIAQEEFGKRIVANMVMLGSLVAVDPLVDRGALEKAVQDSVPTDSVELNLLALQRGFILGESAKEKTTNNSA